MNENIQGVLYLPPYLRQAQSNIDVDCIVVGLLDEVTGLGFAVCGLDDADFQYFFDADIKIKKTLAVDDATTLNDKLDVSNDISSTSGDVKAGSISLKTHTHPINAAQFTGTIDPATGSATGSISGNTEAPT